MRYAIETVAVSLVFGFAAGMAAARWARRLRAPQHLALEDERPFAALHDGLLQDVQGLALSLQAVADQLPSDAPARQRLEQILDRIEELLKEGQKRAKAVPYEMS